MGDNSTEVQSNVIYVPFRLIQEIYTVHAHGGDIAVLAVASGASELVVETIIKFKKRKEMRHRYLAPTSREPA